jgi:CRISPR type I-E-associated protein CasB/Cse2
MSDYERDLDSGIGKIAEVLKTAKGARAGGGFFNPGDVAELRRMNTSVPCGAFWRLMVTFIPEGHRIGEEKERRWAVICQGMAWMAPHIHDGSKRPGQALSLVGYSSEDRPIKINRLFRASDDTFDDLFLSACRFLGSKAQPVDWRSFAKFALYRGDTERKQLARDFYSNASAVPAEA